MPPSASPDRSWAARAEALKRERPAQIAVVLALAAFMAALAGWIAVLIAPGGNIRFNPVFWLLAGPVMAWLWGAQSFAAWAVKPLWFMLVLAPCLSLLALIVAQRIQPLTGGTSLATPLAMRVILGITMGLAATGLVALHRSSLPGGRRPAAYLPPGTPMPAARLLSQDATGTLMLGSLPLSGALVNGLFFAIVATMDPVGSYGMVWPAVLVSVLVLTSGTLIVRGGYRLARQRPGAVADLRRGWWSGMACTIAAFAGVWAWPTILTAKLGLSCLMLPLAVAAAWCGRAALRALPGIVAKT